MGDWGLIGKLGDSANMKNSEPIRASSKYACLTCSWSLDLSKSSRVRSVVCSAPGAYEYLWPYTRAQVLSPSWTRARPNCYAQDLRSHHHGTVAPSRFAVVCSVPVQSCVIGVLYTLATDSGPGLHAIG